MLFMDSSFRRSFHQGAMLRSMCFLYFMVSDSSFVSFICSTSVCPYIPSQYFFLQVYHGGSVAQEARASDLAVKQYSPEFVRRRLLVFAGIIVG